MFPSRSSDYGKGAAAGSGVGGADRPMAAEQTEPAGALPAARPKQGVDAKLGL
jgi:hypothetical protein